MDIFHGVFTLFSWLSWKTTHISAGCRYRVSLCYFNRISRASFNEGGGKVGVGGFSPHFLFLHAFAFQDNALITSNLRDWRQQRPKAQIFLSKIRDSVVATFICTAASAGKTKKNPPPGINNGTLKVFK